MTPEIAQLAIRDHLTTGGSTFDPRTGESLSSHNGWTTAAMPESSHVSDRMFSPEEYQQFALNHADIFSRHANSALGTYYDPTTGLHHIETVAVTPNKKAATEHAASVGDQTIYHLGRAEHSIVGDGEVRPDLIPHTFEERFESIRAASPARTPFKGSHFTSAKLDAIDGTRRGSSGIGAEASRVRLGSQSGQGPDAPAGFHVYAHGALPDPAFSQASNIPVEGLFSFARTSDPEFQQGYAQGHEQATSSGADPTTAHGLGLNNAEHAVRDAGYDGYYNPRTPQSRFLFGSHTPRRNDVKTTNR